MTAFMQPPIRWLVVLTLAVSLALGVLLLDGAGFTGHSWYSRVTTILPAFAGAIIGLRVERTQWKAGFASRAVTLLLAWGIATLLMLSVSMAFASLYDVAFDGPQLFRFARVALQLFVIGATAAMAALAVITAVRMALKSEAA